MAKLKKIRKNRKVRKVSLPVEEIELTAKQARIKAELDNLRQLDILTRLAAPERNNKIYIII